MSLGAEFRAIIKMTPRYLQILEMLGLIRVVKPEELKDPDPDIKKPIIMLQPEERVMGKANLDLLDAIRRYKLQEAPDKLFSDCNCKTCDCG